MRESEGLSNLDLDTLAWRATDPPERLPVDESKEAQDANLEMLVDWISQFGQREDSFPGGDTP